ncbi:MAG: TonB-dependent receptor plug domain-containing protein [Gemmatimonadota bacterium]
MITRRICGPGICSLLLLTLVSLSSAAQEAVTITGHVSSAGLPVRGAKIRIDSLNLGSTSNDEGRYSFIVPSIRVRGQTVQLTASYLRFPPQNVPIQLVGGALNIDFDINTAPPARTPPRTDPPRTTPATGVPEATPATTAPDVAAVEVAGRAAPLLHSSILDSLVFGDVAGSTDLASALAGRLAGVEVQTAATFGGASSLIVRGPRSIIGLTQPLVVVDGVLADNSNVSETLQRVGQGGFDYGTTIGDLNLDDIATLEVVRGPAASRRFGGRGANGAIVITTKSARGLRGFAVSANQQITREAAVRLPSYQNAYGQGLRGAFAFFDGKGGGVNDATDQSWGPALDGSAVLQASLVEAGRPDVRQWVARPDNVSSYFVGGSTRATNVAVLGGDDQGHFRAAVSNRFSSGITPQSTLTRRDAVFSGGVQATSRIAVDGSFHIYNEVAQDRPGTGFDESNPVSGFSHMGRQVDVQTYQTLQRDFKAAQLSWNYNGRNNPYWAALQNDNHDNRLRALLGVTTSVSLTSWLTGSATIGADRSSDDRIFSVAGGWMGGFPYFKGRGDFSTGGSQNTNIRRAALNYDAMLQTTSARRGELAVSASAGLGHRNESLDLYIQATDRLVAAEALPSASWNGSSSSDLAFGGIDATFRERAALSAGVRYESAAPSPAAHVGTIYPSVQLSYGVIRPDSLGSTRTLQSLVVRGGWSRAGNDATAATLQRLGLIDPAVTGPTLGTPETTNALEAGVSAALWNDRVAFDLTYYREGSNDLLLPAETGYLRTGSMSNNGIETTVAFVPLRLDNGLEWRAGLTFGMNSNTVGGLSGTNGTIALGPSIDMLSIVARPGYSLGALFGTQYLRDGAGNLLLRNGVPQPDSVSGAVFLGQGVPSWIGGLSSSLRFKGAEVSLLLDAHHGGKIYSASNRAGAYSGVLEETAFRPDTGLLIVGLDVVTGRPNTTHATTEDYYHALGSISERWIYDASFVKLREFRLSYALPLRFFEALRAQSIRLSFIGRNLAMWTPAANIDPETILSTSTYRGAELGQLPRSRSVGFQLSLTP